MDSCAWSPTAEPVRGGDTLSVISYRHRREVARLPMGQGAQELIVGAVPDAVLRRTGFRLPIHRKSVRRKTVHRASS